MDRPLNILVILSLYNNIFIILINNINIVRRTIQKLVYIKVLKLFKFNEKNQIKTCEIKQFTKKITKTHLKIKNNIFLFFNKFIKYGIISI